MSCIELYHLRESTVLSVNNLAARSHHNLQVEAVRASGQSYFSGDGRWCFATDVTVDFPTW